MKNHFTQSLILLILALLVFPSLAYSQDEGRFIVVTEMTGR